jgi:hypothetical protein
VYAARATSDRALDVMAALDMMIEMLDGPSSRDRLALFELALCNSQIIVRGPVFTCLSVCLSVCALIYVHVRIDGAARALRGRLIGVAMHARRTCTSLRSWTRCAASSASWTS